jgi:hypothetical protein
MNLLFIAARFRCHLGMVDSDLIIKLQGWNSVGDASEPHRRGVNKMEARVP